MSSASELLGRLREFHEPPPPAAAQPWLVLLCLGILAMLAAYGVYRLLQRNQRRSWRTDALRTVTLASRQRPAQAQLTCARLLGQLLRQRYGDLVNRLDSPARLQLLDRTLATDWFTTGRGSVFGDALFQPQTACRFDPADDCATLRRLIARQPRWPRLPTDRQTRRQIELPPADAISTTLAARKTAK